MAFAKMQTPQTLRESYLLTDADFETIREGEDASVGGQEPDVEEVSWAKGNLKSLSFT